MTISHEEALDLDPRSTTILEILARRNLRARRYAEGEAYYERAITLRPDDPTLYFFKAVLYLAWDGTAERAQRVVEAASGRADLLLFTLANWDFDDEMMLRIFSDHFDDAILRRTLDDPGDSVAYYFAKGDAAGRNSSRGTAAAYYDSARVVLERRIDQAPGSERDLKQLGLAHARLGNADEARRIAAGLSRLAHLPTAAEIYLLIGESDAAIDLLEQTVEVED